MVMAVGHVVENLVIVLRIFMRFTLVAIHIILAAMRTYENVLILYSVFLPIFVYNSYFV